jgi:hypothetical protein
MPFRVGAIAVEPEAVWANQGRFTLELPRLYHALATKRTDSCVFEIGA